jgi:hypothetical protein
LKTHASDPESDIDRSRTEHRETTRLSMLGELAGDIMVAQALSIVEISDGGLQIVTTFPLQMNSIHDVRIPLEPSLVTKCRVVHSGVVDVEQEIVRYRVGLQFVELDARLRDALSAYVERKKADRGR